MERHGQPRSARRNGRPALVVLIAVILLAAVGAVLVSVRTSPTAAVSLVVDGDQFTVSSALGPSRISIGATTTNRASNGAFNLEQTLLDGSLIHRTGDDVAPIRTQLGTLGGNHALTRVASFPNPDGKTVADLGSVWSDGAREYVLLGLDESDRLLVGGSYRRVAGVVTAARIAPRGALTHVAGATHRAPIATAGIDDTARLYPSTGRVQVALDCDGASVSGSLSRGCAKVSVHESYDILDYADLYDQAKAHVGQRYSDLEIAGALHVDNQYAFTDVGRTWVRSELTALRPTELGNLGGVQSMALVPEAGDRVIRQLPGVRPVAGHDFARGVDLASYADNVVISSRDLTPDAAPPTFALDRLIGADGRTRVGFALGYVRSGDEAGAQAARARAAASVLWDLRKTRKSYPVALDAARLSPGDRVAVEGFRVYLPPAEADRLAQAVAAGGAGDWEPETAP